MFEALREWVRKNIVDADLMMLSDQRFPLREYWDIDVETGELVPRWEDISS